MYSVRIAPPVPNSPAVARIELRSDAGNPPTTVRAQIAGGGQDPVDVFEAELTYVVQAGDFVELAVVRELGLPIITLTKVTEIPIG